MDRRGFFRVALASAGATAMLPTASMAGAAAAPPERRRPVRVDRRPLARRERAAAARGLHVPAHRRRGRAGGRHRLPRGTSSPTAPPPSTTATAAGSTSCNSEVFAPDGAGGASGDPLRRRRRDRRRLPGARGHHRQLRRRPDAVGHLAVVRGARSTGRARCGSRPDRRDARPRPARRSAGGPTRPWRSTPTTRRSTSPRTTPAGKLYRFTPDAYPDLSAGVARGRGRRRRRRGHLGAGRRPVGRVRRPPASRCPRRPRSPATRASGTTTARSCSRPRATTASTPSTSTPSATRSSGTARRPTR